MWLKLFDMDVYMPRPTICDCLLDICTSVKTTGRGFLYLLASRGSFRQKDFAMEYLKLIFSVQRPPEAVKMLGVRGSSYVLGFMR